MERPVSKKELKKLSIKLSEGIATITKRYRTSHFKTDEDGQFQANCVKAFPTLRVNTS